MKISCLAERNLFLGREPRRELHAGHSATHSKPFPFYSITRIVSIYKMVPYLELKKEVYINVVLNLEKEKPRVIYRYSRIHPEKKYGAFRVKYA
jgi:hypothetical protein